MNDEFYDRCVVCFDNECELIKCPTCVYRLCRSCIVEIGRVDIRVCKEPQCRYDYLSPDEDCHCYVCNDRTRDIILDCPTCAHIRALPLSDFKHTIQDRVMGTKKLSGHGNTFGDYGIVYFTVKDLDTGESELMSFRTGPKQYINR